MFSSENWFGASPSFYNDVATQSLRFDDDSNSYLNKTLSGSSGNQKTWTYSFWFKHGSRTSLFDFLTANASGDKYFEFTMSSAQKLTFYYHDSTLLLTNMQLRDRSAWYHIAVVHDTTQDDPEDRLKIYVNGVKVTDYETNILNDTNLPEDFDGGVNETGVEHLIGRNQVGNNDLDGYLSDVYLLDGTAVGDTSGVLNEFIEIKNGICIPKKYSGSYGTHGFHFEFKQTGTGTASTSTIGADTSGQTNHYTSNGLDAHDSNLPDSPENNYCTMNPLVPTNGASGALSEGNLKITKTGTTYSFFQSNFGVKTGKWYAEIRCNAKTSYQFMIGITEMNMEAYATGSGNDPHNTAGTIWYDESGYGHYDGSGVAINTFSGGVGFGVGNVIGLALDMDSSTQTIKFYKDGSLVTTKDLPASATDHMSFACNWYNTNTGVWNFGQDGSFAGSLTGSDIGTATDGNGIGAFKYAPPSGYLALCSANLSDNDIPISPNSATQAVNHFGILTYTANGNASRSIVSGASGIGGQIDFKPDWLWVKSRSAGYYHGTWDSNRTNKSALYPNASDDEDTSTAGTIGSLDTNGFTTPNVSGGGFINIGSTTYVAFNWKANGSSTTSHSSGDNGANHASVSQANQTAGFSIVTYTGDTSGNPTKMNHGLGKTPRMIIVKSRSASGSWAVYHEDMNPSSSYNHAMFLDTDADKTSASNAYWGSNAMTLNDNLFSVNNSTETNTNSVTYVAYCFAEVDGFSKFGSYTGTGGSGAVDGVFVFTSFRPAFLMVKLVGAGENWHMFDSTRSTSNVIISRLIADDVTAENNNDSILDFLSNGFKFREGNAGWNGTGSYIYMAFAEAPFKYANAR